MNGLTCFKVPIAGESFIEILLICVDQERVSSIVSPRDFEELTLMISFRSICARKEAQAWLCSL